jgi:hypothetical protein
MTFEHLDVRLGEPVAALEDPASRVHRDSYMAQLK